MHPPPPSGVHVVRDPTGTASSEDALHALRAVRSIVQAAARGNNPVDPSRPDPGHQKARAALGSLALRPTVLGDGRISLAPRQPADLAAMISAAGIAALLGAAARPGWRRLKSCADLDCGRVFLDASRNTSRRWCDMAGCGNRAKTAAFRARRRPGPD